ncbi:MAG: OmpA family protein, partial [Spirochaetaceae bacterium]|nr:OmpA family protein [Spirochaetaceae bacterium]
EALGGGDAGAGAAVAAGAAAASSGLSSAGPGALQSGEELALDLGEGVSAERDPEGILLTVKDLRFAADGDRVLPAEAKRLDAIAAALRGIEGRTFLVSGHTADVGRPADELALSIRRAKGVVDELVARGVPAARLLYRGFGATKPLAPNDTEANKALNRRVEILVLED